MDYILQSIALLKTQRREWEAEYYKVLEECGHADDRMNSSDVAIYVDEITALNGEIGALEELLANLRNPSPCPG